MTIEKITLKNFQAHSKFKLELDKGVTTIVGSSDKGKSAVIRALKWLTFNRPGGEAFIKDGERECSTTIQIDGKEISREKGKENRYIFDNKTMKAMGTEVPKPVEDFLKLNEVNFQDQHDAPFWFSLTAGQVSKALNQIVNLEVMDNAVSFINALLRKIKTEEEVLKGMLEGAQAERKRLKFAKQMNTELEAVETMDKNLTLIRNERIMLGKVLEDITVAGLDRDMSAAKAEGAQTVYDLGRVYWKSLQARSALKDAIGNVVRSEMKASQKIPSLSAVESALESLIKITSSRAEIECFVDKAKEANKTTIIKGQELKAAKEALGKWKVCPTCGKPL